MSVERILEYFHGGNIEATATEVADCLGIKKSAAVKACAYLAQQGKLVWRFSEAVSANGKPARLYSARTADDDYVQQLPQEPDNIDIRFIYEGDYEAAAAAITDDAGDCVALSRKQAREVCNLLMAWLQL